MARFEQKSTIHIYWAIALTMAGVSAVDVYTPLGVAVWILYIVPLVLTFSLWQPRAPLALGAIATALVVGLYFFSPAGVNPAIVRINRGFGVLTIWVMAAASYLSIRNKLAVRKQEWLQSAQTRLSEKMVGDPVEAELGQRILRLLAESLDAQAGALFVESGSKFHRLAVYAMPSDQSVPEYLTPGQGLLGQAAKDRRTFVVNDVPEGYLSVGSALGQGRPRHLLIAPFSVDGSVKAVMELGFIHPTDEMDLALIERVSESIAIAFRSAQYRARLQELLEETQRQSEELQSQSEELRVSNEELEEQGRALKESQARLEQQQAELEQTNTQLEEQSQILEQQRDELRQSGDALEARARELEQSSRYKSEFLANMSHELRTPLNSSLILAKLLADNAPNTLTGEQIRYAQTIYDAGSDLLNLINDILDLSKIEAGHARVHPEEVRLGRLLENLSRMFEPMATQKSLAFRAQAAPGVSETIVTDSQRLEQVLKNLLSNAIKFTDRGEVALDIKATPEGCIAFAVRDTGIGIPEQQQQLVFEAFRQADGTTNRKYGGTGLGLSISRELARLLGGEILLESAPGHGSTFTVVLPRVFDPALVQAAAAKSYTPLPDAAPRQLELPSRSSSPVAAEAAPHSRRTALAPAQSLADDRDQLTPQRRLILVIEDDQPFARILYDLAHESGFQCILAISAEEGIALALRHVPSAVILDVGLPDHSGLSVLDQLKHNARTRHIPVHMASVSDYSQTALSMGAIGFMLKPVKREELIHAFENLQTRLSQRLRRVLVVEDDAMQLHALQQLLQTRDVETAGARSAQECLDQLKTTTFDCMVLDLSLPDASGFSLLETLSNEEAYAFPPVIIYTGRELKADEEQQLLRYSKSIIIKGAKSPERLLDEVTLFLHQVVAELGPEQQKMLQKARDRDAALEGRRVLVVEDDVRNVFAITSILEPRGVKVQIARNGRESLEALEKSAAKNAEPIDLVLMDLMMPEMDGLTAIREIRKRPEWKKLPIIAVTAKAMKDDQQHCLDAGANDYMAKPLDVDKLLSLIRVWMPR